MLKSEMGYNRTTMMFLLMLLLFLIVLPKKAEAAIIIDHNAVNQFEQMPDSAISAAARERLMIRHASIGVQIGWNDSDSGLNRLQAQNSKYNRSNWDFQGRGNPGWAGKIADFETAAAENASSMDIMMMKYCYVDWDADAGAYIEAMNRAESRYPNKTIVWWTMPITTEGSEERDSFNRQVRAYAAANNKVLFDIADIESHGSDGVLKRDSAGREIFDASISSDGGHFTVEGRIMVAKAFWVMVARIAGWSPDGTVISASPTPTRPAATATSTIRPTATIRPSATPTATRSTEPTSGFGASNTPTPTVMSTENYCGMCNSGIRRSFGNADCNDVVDINDVSIWRNEFMEWQRNREFRADWKADFNCDRIVNEDDFRVWKRWFLATL